jgi:hypothetical protein
MAEGETWLCRAVESHIRVPCEVCTVPVVSQERISLDARALDLEYGANSLFYARIIDYALEVSIRPANHRYMYERVLH